MRKVVWVAAGLVVVAMAGALAWYLAATNVETPDYAVERSVGRIEVRRYPEMIAAEVIRTGDRGSAVRAGFGPLARYIFGRERGGDRIAMTAPVTQTPEKVAMTAPVTQTAGGDGWRVRFLMPGGWTLETLPEPGPEVRLVAVPAETAAAIRFSGAWTDERFAAVEAELRAWMAAEGLEASGPATLAYYNDPFTPWFLRRNEVIIPLGE